MVRINILVQLRYPFIRTIAKCFRWLAGLPATPSPKLLLYSSCSKRQRDRKKKGSWFPCKFRKHFLDVHWLLNKNHNSLSRHTSPSEYDPIYLSCLVSLKLPGNSLRSHHNDLLLQPGMPGVFTILYQIYPSPNLPPTVKIFTLPLVQALLSELKFVTLLFFCSFHSFSMSCGFS